MLVIQESWLNVSCFFVSIIGSMGVYRKWLIFIFSVNIIILKSVVKMGWWGEVFWVWIMVFFFVKVR